MNSTDPGSIEPIKTPITPQSLVAIQRAFNGLSFGQVTVTVQDGKIIQIDRVERHRLPSEKALK